MTAFKKKTKRNKHKKPSETTIQFYDMTCKLWTIPMPINGGADERFRNANSCSIHLQLNMQDTMLYTGTGLNKQIAKQKHASLRHKQPSQSIAMQFQSNRTKNDWCSAYVFVNVSPTKRHRRNIYFAFISLHSQNWHYILLHFLLAVWRIIKSPYWTIIVIFILYVCSLASKRPSGFTSGRSDGITDGCVE